MNRFIAEVTEKVSALTGRSRKEIEDLVESPPEPTMGDCAVPCFTFAGEMRKPPAVIAKDLASRLQGKGSWTVVNAAGPYLNFFFPRKDFIRELLLRVRAARKAGKPFGSGSDDEVGGKVVIDFSSPNIAKPFHIGHLRSTNIGAALYRLFSFLGYDVTGINHLGDWGTQVGKQITAYNRWGGGVSMDRLDASELTELYVRFHREAESDPSLEDEARNWFSRLEKKDPDALAFWKKVKRIGLDDFNRIYDRLDVHFDLFMGESEYITMADNLLDRLIKNGIAVKSQGAWIVELDQFGLPPCLVRKKDGSTVYITRDLAAAEYRMKEYRFNNLFYVVGAPQSLHFKQMKAVLKRMGYDWADRIEHVEFGHLRLKEQSLATRAGNVILLEDVLDRAENLTSEIIREKNPDLANSDEVARAVGTGAVKYADLRVQRIKEVVFDWDRVLSFDGDSGPYAQYTHVRLASLLDRYGEAVPENDDFDRLGLEEEFQLARLVDMFPEKMRFAAAEREPSILAGHLRNICRTFNGYYNAHRIITNDIGATAQRIELVAALQETVSSILSILGLVPLERM